MADGGFMEVAGGAERLTGKAERMLKFNREHVIRWASRRRERGPVSERVCDGACAGSPLGVPTYFPLAVSVSLSLAPGLHPDTRGSEPHMMATSQGLGNHRIVLYVPICDQDIIL